MPPCPRGDRVRQQETILAEGWKSLALSPSLALARLGRRVWTPSPPSPAGILARRRMIKLDGSHLARASCRKLASAHGAYNSSNPSYCWVWPDVQLLASSSAPSRTRSADRHKQQPRMILAPQLVYQAAS